MDRWQREVKEFIDQHRMLEGIEGVVVGVSGGADSMALLHILLELGQHYAYEILAVHIHHGIRGREADEDEAFVKATCDRWGVKYKGFHFDIPTEAKKQGCGEEEAGRRCRYRAFEEAAKGWSRYVIAVAHHQDDQVETMLHHFIRGTGLKGLGGMRPVRGQVIRPLLNKSRSQLETYLRQHHIDFRSDSTNDEVIYTRNKLRNQLIPEIKENFNSNLAKTMSQMGDLFQSEEDFMEVSGLEAFNQCVSQEGQQWKLNLEKFQMLHIALQRRVVRSILTKYYEGLRDITFVHVEDVLKLAVGEVGKRIALPKGLEVSKDYQEIVFGRKTSDNKVEKAIEIISFPVKFYKDQEPYILDIVEAKSQSLGKMKKKNYTKCFDYDKIKYTLSLRTRQPGDYIYLRGLKGRKKLKDLFIDEKIPRDDRDQILLLADGHEIIWIPDMRENERYQVTDETNKVLRVGPSV